MQVDVSSSAAEFLSRVGHILTSDEARYGLINGIARRLVGNPHFYGSGDPWFRIVRNSNEIWAVAIRTPPFKVLLAHFSGDEAAVARTLVNSISRSLRTIRGVVGDLALADSFARRWCAKYSVSVVGRIAQRIYRLDKVNAVSTAPGCLREASLGEKELVQSWSDSFNSDVFGAASPNKPQEDITPAIERKDVYVWENVGPVSMARKTRPTENGVTVSGVYTPSRA